MSNSIGNSSIEVYFTPNPNIPLLTLTPTTVEEVEKFLMKIPDSKPTGDDGPLIRYIKCTKLKSAKIICHIINLTVKTNKIPLDWKNASITPLFKDGQPDDPIILERVIHSQLYAHIVRHMLLPEDQFGFRKYQSTNTCVLNMLDKIYKNVEHYMLTGVVFLNSILGPLLFITYIDDLTKYLRVFC